MTLRKIIVLTLITLVTSCQPNLTKSTNEDTYPLDLKKTCINSIEFNNANGKSCVFSYFSEYSNLSFFITLNRDYLYFETFSKVGTIKPSLLFYIEKVDTTLHERVFKYFNQVQTFSNYTLNKSNSNKDVCMIIDHYSGDTLISGEGDKFPLTRIESKLIITRYINLLNKKFNAHLKFDEEMIKPFFYQMCNYENEINHWHDKFPEISKHELIY
ncbi:MAG: hypothetical protein ACTHJT_04490 [Cytophaga sp.]|uniref:hypothetical protein n=1 Tax=Cytophaga sp. TaxID=29535 RepID=UPI003F822B66